MQYLLLTVVKPLITQYILLWKKEKEKERGEKGFKIAASGTVKTELISCRSSGTLGLNCTQRITYIITAATKTFAR